MPELTIDPESVAVAEELATDQGADTPKAAADQSLPDLVAEVQADELPADLPTPADDALSLDPAEGSPDALAASADELAEFARAVQFPASVDEIDSVAATADLVDEAVASFEEQLGDVISLSDLASSMPPLAKALVEGERVSLEDMESVIEEHDRTGLSIARILTSRSLVSEADLMWGMAQEMGLEFVDLDVAGVNYTASVLIPEATARHHNVLVIDEEAGVPIIAASNPTDVVALDDLRTIIGRAFTIVVATRSQISTAIGKAYHGVGDAADMAKTASLDFGREESGPSTTSRPSPKRRRSFATSTSWSSRRSTSGPRTSTSSRPTTTSGSGTGSTACSTTCRRRPDPSPLPSPPA